MDLDVGDVARSETITTGAADPSREFALVQGDPGLLRGLGELIAEVGLQLLNPSLVALSIYKDEL